MNRNRAGALPFVSVVLLLTVSSMSSAWAASPPSRVAAPSSSRSPAADADATNASSSSSLPWSARPYQYSIGFEGNTTGTSTMLGANAITLGRWVNPKWGYEILIAFSKSSDSISESQNTSVTPLSGATTATTSYSGARNPYVFSLGFLPKLKAFHNSWLMVYGGFLVALTYNTSTSYQTGTFTVSTPNALEPQNQTVSESNYGTSGTDAVLSMVVGPRIGSEMYIPSLPNVAIGFAAGLVTALSGDIVTNVSGQTQNYAVVNGVAQSPTNVTNNNYISRSKPGVSGSTVAIAGQAFDLFGSFTIRYVW